VKTAVPLLCIGLILSGCGSSEPSARTGIGTQSERSSSAPATPATPATPGDAAVASYVAWLDALQDHDAAAACARHAPELTIALRQEAILVDRAELGDPCTGFVAILWEDPEREYEPLGVEATQVTDEDAILAADFPGLDQTVTMARTDGSWFVAASTARTVGGSDPEHWLTGWCDLELGMDRAAVVAVMGAPSGEYTVSNGGEPQLYWARRQYDFRAYLDLDGRVLDLVGDYDALSAEDRSRLSCPELR
jgi:hypothetical protein